MFGSGFGFGNFTWNTSSEKVGEILRRKGTADLRRKIVSGKTFAGRNTTERGWPVFTLY